MNPTCPHARWNALGICEGCGIQGVKDCPDCGIEFMDLVDEHGVTTYKEARALSATFRDCRTCDNQREVPDRG